MCLVNESHETPVRPSSSGGYVKAPVDQLEEWTLEKPIPYIFNDNFSQEGIFHYWIDQLSGHAHANQTYPDVVKMWRQFPGIVALHLEEG